MDKIGAKNAEMILLHETHVATVEYLHEQELDYVQTQLNTARKRTGKLEGNLKTIAENRARSDNIKKETDAILDSFLASDIDK